MGLNDSILLANIPTSVPGNPVDEEIWATRQVELTCAWGLTSIPRPLSKNSFQPCMLSILRRVLINSLGSISLLSREFCLQYPQGWELHRAPQLAHHLTWPCGGCTLPGQRISPPRLYRCWKQAVPWKPAAPSCDPQLTALQIRAGFMNVPNHNLTFSAILSWGRTVFSECV